MGALDHSSPPRNLASRIFIRPAGRGFVDARWRDEVARGDGPVTLTPACGDCFTVAGVDERFADYLKRNRGGLDVVASEQFSVAPGCKGLALSGWPMDALIERGDEVLFPGFHDFRFYSIVYTVGWARTRFTMDGREGKTGFQADNWAGKEIRLLWRQRFTSRYDHADFAGILFCSGGGNPRTADERSHPCWVVGRGESSHSKSS